jgi:hypothetical protein
MRLALFALRPIRLRLGTWPAGATLHTSRLGLAVSLVEAGAAVPNDAGTADELELALRLRALARERGEEVG